MTDPTSWSSLAGVGLVANVTGDVHEVFAKVDANGDGAIDKDELRRVLSDLRCYLSDEEFEALFLRLDEDSSGTALSCAPSQFRSAKANF
eukprot:10464201-Ditylum_brightwellii.AAC.1